MSDGNDERVSLSEIARQMREKKANQPPPASGPVREAQSSAVQAEPRSPGATVSAARTGLRALARAHRLQLSAFALAIAGFFAVVYFSDPTALAEGTGFAPNLLFAAVAVSIAATWWVIFRLHGMAGILIGLLLSLVTLFSPYRPLIGFVAFVTVSSIASRRLRKAGAKVGLLGVSPSSLPD